MVLINYAENTVQCKIVYYGPEQSGKTTNLKYIYDNIDASLRSELTSIEGEQNNTLFFDFMSVDLGEVKGFKTKYSLYSVPGQKELEAMRKIVLNGVDGIIFVVDSRVDKLNENVESLKALEKTLIDQGISLDSIPLVFQYNKRDTENTMPLDELEKALNKNLNPCYEAVAIKGTGVFATLKAISNRILTSLQ